MAVNLSPVAGAAAQFFDNSGNVLTGGKLYTYSAGTTTPAVTYTNNSGVTAHANPIVLNAAGRVPDSGEIWLSDNVSYKFVLKDSNDVLIATYDNLVGINSNFVNFTGEEETQTATQGQTVFTLTTLQYTPAVNNLLVFVNGSKQVINDNYIETSSTVVTFVDGLNVGDVVDFCTATPINTSVVDAANVSFTGFKGQDGNVQNLADDDGSDWVGFLPSGVNAVARSAQDKMRDFVSVKDFGAVGDGIAHDNVAVQAALDYMYANNICTLYFPDGTYYFDAPVTILFDGVDAKHSFRFIGTSTACQGAGALSGPLYNGSTITGKASIESMFIFSKTDLTVGNGYAFECSNISFISGASGTTGPLTAIKNKVAGYPARPFVVKNCYFFSFDKAIVSDITESGLTTGICQVAIKENNFINGNYSLYGKGPNAIMDLDFSNNVSEQGAKIFTETGALGGTFRIADNLLEGQVDAIILGVGLGAGEIVRNYFEINSGYLFSVAASAACYIDVGPNYITNCVGAKVEFNNCNVTSNQPLETYGVKVFLTNVSNGYLNNKSTLYTDQGFSANLNLDCVSILSSLPPAPLTDGAYLVMASGTSEVTPIGTVKVETITVAATYNPPYSFNTGDWIVVMALARRRVGDGGLYVGIYSNTNVFCGTSNTSQNLGEVAIGEWVFVMRVVQVTASSVGFYKVRWAVQAGSEYDVSDNYVYKIATPTANVTPVYYCMPNL
jgi:hypothetical protein